MDASVIIPTYRRPEKLAACLRSLSAQHPVPGGFEVLVGFDGPDADGLREAGDAWEGPPGSLRLLTCDRVGYTRVRNALLPLARGEFLISTNDDVVPEPGFVAAHVARHRRARENVQNVVVSGDSRWRVPPNETAWDRLVRETPMIFFDAVMRLSGQPPDKDWGFRHAWGLNLSAETALVREVGGFTEFPAWYGYEDTELPFKLGRRFGPTPVVYEPAARLEHDHRVGAEEYVRREYSLGFAALGFATISPECAAATFGRNVADPSERDYCRAFVAREGSAAVRAWRAILTLEMTPGTHVETERLDAEYRAHLPLKRWAWRSGLLDAFARRAPDAGTLVDHLKN
mgnify:CR=1 FL=1